MKRRKFFPSNSSNEASHLQFSNAKEKCSLAHTSHIVHEYYYNVTSGSEGKAIHSYDRWPSLIN